MQRQGSVAVVFGTRPEIVKLAGVVQALGERCQAIWTGQHYDETLAGDIFRGLGLPDPQVRLAGVGGLDRGRQIGAVITELSQRFAVARPDVVIVQGDTNSTSAGAQAAHYHGVPVVHVEAGLRSRDRAMPEEINRQVVGVLADVHCAPTEEAVRNLLAEGVPAHRVHLTGNTVVEAVHLSLPAPELARSLPRRYGLRPGGYVLATIHRPENTDDPERMARILHELGALSIPVLFPAHPRTVRACERHGLGRELAALGVVPPVDHASFLGLAQHAALLVSDSGGVQEECTVLKKPLIVVRNSTERPEAVESGFAALVRPGPLIGTTARRLLGDPDLPRRLAARPSPYGDGRASGRIVALAIALADRAGAGHTGTGHTGPALAADPIKPPEPRLAGQREPQPTVHV
ncbi:UDP-N-acetylglucosamine 2-epimerase (non-hydrolyzing) [Streptacidiphilus sp. MAP12-20]|uniref:non-hydrolyzing UDP-N-acetylglucosamine 2-epimerase n=1 Tax=Streptacidiphilus sp. MAP12-20 TaxID=3156299 RepID=UPI003514E007